MTALERHPDDRHLGGGHPVDLEAGTVVLGGRRVLDAVDLHLHAGESVALLGANGSGKSTLVRTLVGLVPLTAGRLRLYDVPADRFRDWSRVGYVPQRLTVASGVPAAVREVVASGRLARLGLFGRRSAADARAVTAALDAVGLADRADDSVAELSGGQQQRVLIARALAGEPELLLLDEPTAGVDAASQEVFARTLGDLLDRGATVLLVAHELGPLEPLVRRAVVLRDGRVVHDGAPPPPAVHHAHADHDHVHPHEAPAHEHGWVPR